MTSPRLMRQSLLGSWDICGRRAWYSLQGHPYATSYAAARGTAYHKGLEVAYADRILDPGAPFDWELAYEAALAAFRNEVMRAGDQYRGEEGADADTELYTMIKAYLDGDHWRNGQVLAVEQTFSLEWITGKIPTLATGTIDMVWEGVAGLTLVDHKTAGRRWPANKNTYTKLPQAAWYMYAAHRLFGKWPAAFVFDVMLPTGELDRRALPVDQEEIGRVLQRFQETDRVMRTLDAYQVPWPANPAHILCSEKYCDHYNRCPYGAGPDNTEEV